MGKKVANVRAYPCPNCEFGADDDFTLKVHIAEHHMHASDPRNSYFLNISNFVNISSQVCSQASQLYYIYIYKYVGNNCYYIGFSIQRRLRRFLRGYFTEWMSRHRTYTIEVDHGDNKTQETMVFDEALVM